MKFSSIILTLAAMLGTQLTWANGYPADPAADTAASATATGGQGGHGGQGFGGSAGASSGSTAMGGSAGASAGASAGGGLAAAETGSVLDASSSSSKYLNLSLSMPQPVWTAVPTAFGCLVTESKAGAIGWSFVSSSKTTQFSDVVCTTIRMAEAANLHCQFASAAYLNKRAFESMYPGLDGDFFLADVPKNIGPVECEELKRPKLQLTPALAPQPAPQPVANTVTVTCPTPAAPVRSVPTRRAPVKKQPNTCTK